MTADSLTLSTLNTRIREATENAFPQSVWVIAEILEMQVNRSGHCYLELIEKSITDNAIIARTRATIWVSRFNMIRSYFETTTRAKLEPGIKVLLKASVTFHGIYGLSLNVTDIDPNFTIGDMAVKKQEIINRLVGAGVIEMNKELSITLVPQRIAVISSESAAGYGDFIDSLLNNNFGFTFQITLFPAIVQGDAAEKSIISALEHIFDQDSSFDVVVLIRGGGSQADLECFNGYDLALNIAQFPLPVLTGIGHERDETIADIVAYKSLKTPTAVAEFLLDTMQSFADRLKQLQDRFTQSIRWIIQDERSTLQQKASDLKHFVELSLLNETRDLMTIQSSLKRITFENIKSNSNKLEGFEKSLLLLRPERVLARGYSISSINGKAIKSVKNLRKGTKIETRISDGIIESTIDNIEKKGIKNIN